MSNQFHTMIKGRVGYYCTCGFWARRAEERDRHLEFEGVDKKVEWTTTDARHLARLRPRQRKPKTVASPSNDKVSGQSGRGKASDLK